MESIYKYLYIFDVLRPKLLNIPLASCFLINLDFLLPHIAHFDNIIVLPLLGFETLGFIFSVCFLHFKLFYILDFKLLLINSLRLITSSMPFLLRYSIK